MKALEDNEWFNAGRGAVFTRDGGVELEASVSTELIFFSLRVRSKVLVVDYPSMSAFRDPHSCVCL